MAMDPPKMNTTPVCNAKLCPARDDHCHVKEECGDDQPQEYTMFFDILECMTEHTAIITVAYKNYTVLHEFLDCLRSQVDKNFHVFISDASPEKGVINVDDLDATVIPIENNGYAYGVNVGVREARKMGITKFCVINDDVVMKENFTQILNGIFASHPQAAFGGKIYYAPGFEFHTEKYSKDDLGNVLWYAGGTVDWKHSSTHHRGVDVVDTGQFNTVESTEFVTGCLFCFDQAVLDAVGFWDEKYFLYYEDADYSERVKHADIPLEYHPDLVIWHKNAQSTDGSGSDLHVKLQKKAHLRFAWKYAPWRTKLHVLKNYLI